jgi:hypothetical protein
MSRNKEFIKTYRWKDKPCFLQGVNGIASTTCPLCKLDLLQHWRCRQNAPYSLVRLQHVRTQTNVQRHGDFGSNLPWLQLTCNVM